MWRYSSRYLYHMSVSFLWNKESNQVFLPGEKIYIFFLSPFYFFISCHSYVPLSFLSQKIVFLSFDQFSISCYNWLLIYVIHFRTGLPGTGQVNQAPGNLSLFNQEWAIRHQSTRHWSIYHRSTRHRATRHWSTRHRATKHRSSDTSHRSSRHWSSSGEHQAPVTGCQSFNHQAPVTGHRAPVNLPGSVIRQKMLGPEYRCPVIDIRVLSIH